MQDKITVFKDRRYILVQSHHNTDKSVFESTINKLVALNSLYGIAKVLVDSRMRTKAPTTLDQYQTGKFFADSTRGKLQIAILVENENADTPFFENVSVNRGANVLFFNSEVKAKKWLEIHD